MLFNSFEFLVFFPLVSIVYFVLAPRWRWLWVLGASCYFYMAFQPIYILILAGTITIDYFAGLFIAQSEGRRRKLYLIASIVANVGVLAFFKYFNFLNDNIRDLLAAGGTHWPVSHLDILLPIGLSFHTFQSLSYTIEVYRGRQTVERSFGIFALYVMFYPQLVAGPIERPQNLLRQFHTAIPFDHHRVRSGLVLMGWGFFKKVVIADRLAPFVNAVYDSPTGWPGISLLVATVFFAFQIYCDFSGYSDIALGSAQVMGFKLMKNFDAPYLSSSVGDFWRRWHISLSTWFRDYVYIPMGGSQSPRLQRYFNLLVTFLLSGLWHGASWTYVIWGGLNGLYLVIEQALGWAPSSHKDRQAAPWGVGRRFVGWAITFSAISLSWIFFRARTLSDAIYVVGHLGDGLGSVLFHLTDFPYLRFYVMMRQSKVEFFLAVALIGFLLTTEAWNRRVSLREVLERRSAPIRWVAYYALLMAVVFLGAFNSVQQFIYFQF